MCTDEVIKHDLNLCMSLNVFFTSMTNVLKATMNSRLKEIIEIENLIKNLGDQVRVNVIAQVKDNEIEHPIYSLSFGSADPQAPVLGIVAGVHGLERIGSEVCMSLLNHFVQTMAWDRQMQAVLQRIRIFFIPTINPYGIKYRTRSNQNGIDLMRNAPVEAEGAVSFLVGGHRHSPRLPWFRGREQQMEIESSALVAEVERQISHSVCSFILDIHSGFGGQDRLWFPFAKSTKPYQDLSLVWAFKKLFEGVHPFHFYKIEPQSINYTTHGDLWDYLYLRHEKHALHVPELAKEYQQEKHNLTELISQGKDFAGPFLPICLEMGSWMWLKKNPLQIFSALGPFNPIKRHRHQRVLRRHKSLFEFLIRMMNNYDVWLIDALKNESEYQNAAKSEWYKE